MGSSRNITEEAHKESSEELSSLAGRVLNIKPIGPAFLDVYHLADMYNNLLADAKRLAGSVLSQDETPMSATDFESPV